MPRTSWNAIKKVELLCPAIDEQIAIASILDKIDEDIDQTEISLSKLELLKQGLMQDLLSGRVRVE